MCGAPRRGSSRGVRRVAWAAALALLPAAAAADRPLLCLPGFIGCDGPLAPRDPLDLRPREEPPRFVLPPTPSDVPVDPRRGALADLDAGVPTLAERGGLRRMRPRGDSILPPVTGRPMGRDPRAVQRFQAPYRFD